MKLLLFAHITPSGGTGTYFKQLVEFLKTENYDFSVVLQQRDILNPDIKPLIEKLNVIPYITHYKLEYFIFRVFRRLKLEDIYCYYRDLFLARKFEKKYNSDLFFVSQGGGYEFQSFLKAKKPVIFVIHSLTLQQTGFKYKFFLNKFKKNNNTRNKCIVNVSETANKLFMQFSPVKNIRSVAVPNFARDYGVKKDKHDGINVLTVGHLQSWKNPELWAQVASKLAAEYENVTFYWAGLGEMFNEIQEKVKAYNNIKLLGFISNLEKYYKMTDIYFQPSILESQGLAVVEALGCGIPCVVSNAGGLPDSITDGVDGFVCDLNMPEEFYEKIKILITDKKLRKTMAENARLKYDQKFSSKIWEGMMAKLIESLV